MTLQVRSGKYEVESKEKGVRAILLASLVAGVVGASIVLQGQAGPPDIILTNAKVITVDDQFSIAQAVAVRGDRIVAVGSNADINRLAGPSTRRIDVRGRTIMPGFIDNHAHFQEEGAYWTLELRFDGVTSRKQAWELLRAKAQASGPGKWVYNLGGWSPDQFVEDKKLPTRDELDKYSPDNPVFLQASRAETFINSKAIEVLKLESMKEPWICAMPAAAPPASSRPGAATASGTWPTSSTHRTADAPISRPT